VKQAQLSARQGQLQMLKRQHQELMRKAAILRRAAQFTARARELSLQPDAWTLYDVNVQSPLDFETAQEIVYLCGDSSLAYFWPISLEIKKQNADTPQAGTPQKNAAAPTDVQLSVKGRFAARRR
jgi:hypothetical protein